MKSVEYSRGEFTVSTDRSRLDLKLVHDFLGGSYWAKDIPRDVFVKSVEKFPVLWSLRRAASDWLCAGNYRLRDICLSRGRVHHRISPRAGTGKLPNGMYRAASAVAGTPALDTGYSRCAPAIRKIRIQDVGQA